MSVNPFEETSALLKLAAATEVAGHTRISKKTGQQTQIAAYVRRILESFGDGADADTKRGEFTSKLNLLRAGKGDIGLLDLAKIRAEIDGRGEDSDDPVERLKRKRNQKDPHFNKVKMSNDDLELIELAVKADPNLLELGSRASLDRSPKKNWIENTGNLPGYVREIANSLHTKRGMTISRAIATALSRIRVWARGGDNVDADTVAKSVAALAEWEALRAKNAARRARTKD